MAVTKVGNRWYDDSKKRWYRNEPVEPGDTIECLTNSSTTFRRGDTLVVGSVSTGAYEYEYVKTPNGSRNEYEPVYWQNFIPTVGGVQRSMKNWKKVEKSMNQLALESNEPCIVQEIKDTVVYGKTVTTNVGDPIEMENMSAARIYTTNEITTSIREKNEYRQFAIYQRKHIARAKKPEIEFA